MFRVSSFGFRVSGLGFRVQGFEFRVSGFGIRQLGLRVCIQCACGGCTLLGMQAQPLIARLHQHVVTPARNHPNYSEFGSSPQTPQERLSCSLAPFRVLHISTKFHSKTQLRWIGVGLWSRSNGFNEQPASFSALTAERSVAGWRH